MCDQCLRYRQALEEIIADAPLLKPVRPKFSNDMELEDYGAEMKAWELAEIAREALNLPTTSGSTEAASR